jgi:methionyl-tRNA formyltransferase
MQIESAHNPPSNRRRILFFGMHGAFSRAPLAALLTAGLDVRAVLVPGSADAHKDDGILPVRPLVPRPVLRSTLPLVTPFHQPSIVSQAWEREIPVLEVACERDPRALTALAAFEADVACVACWPRRMPPALLALFRAGCLNVHPSLLPTHRGPAPLFWTLRAGDSCAGVTVHLMDETLDGGDIVAQEAFPVPEGVTGATLETRSAEVGGRLLVSTLADGDIQCIRQSAGAGSYEPWPEPDDFVVTPDRSARWAFNFLRGAGYWGGPLIVGAAGRRFTVSDALEYDPTGSLGAAYQLDGSTLRLQCTPGILTVRVA